MTRNELLKDFSKDFDDVIEDFCEKSYTPDEFMMEDVINTNKYIVNAYIGTVREHGREKYEVMYLEVFDEDHTNQAERFENVRIALSKALPYYYDYAAENKALGNDVTYRHTNIWA